MKIFQTYQELITFVIVRDGWRETPYESTRGWERFERFQERYQSFKNFLLCNTWMPGGIFLLLMFIILEANTFQEYSETCYMITTMGVCAYFIKHFEWNQEKIFGLFDNFQMIVNERLPNPRSRVIYEEANAFVEKWTKHISFAFMKVTLPCITIPFLIWSFYLYFIVDLGEDSFYIPFPAWYPIEWKNPPTYLNFFTTEIVSSYYVEKASASCVAFTVGFCRFMDAFAEDIKADTYDLNDHNLVKDDPVGLYRKFCNVIEFHSTVKQFAPDFSDLFNIIYTIYFLWTTVVVCDILLLFEIESMSSNHDIMSLIKLPFLAFWSIAPIFVYCDPSERLSTRFEEIDFYFICDWYLFPKKIQRSLPIVIMNTQTAVVLEGFGNIPCTRETFKNVTNAGVSYFMVIREFL